MRIAGHGGWELGAGDLRAGIGVLDGVRLGILGRTFLQSPVLSPSPAACVFRGLTRAVCIQPRAG